MSNEPMTATDTTIPRIFYHGTRADLKPGDPIEAGYVSNYGKRKKGSWVYLTGTLDAAVWGAELAAGDGPGRIYVVEPTGPIMDDPNLTDNEARRPAGGRSSTAVFRGNEARSHAGGMASTAVTFSPTAPARRSGSRARSRPGKVTPPNGSRK